MVKEISEWFRLGFDYTNHKCTGNMMSAGKHPQVIEEYLNNEISLGRVVDVESLPACMVVSKVKSSDSPIRALRQTEEGKWRLILRSVTALG